MVSVVRAFLDSHDIKYGSEPSARHTSCPFREEGRGPCPSTDLRAGYPTLALTRRARRVRRASRAGRCPGIIQIEMLSPHRRAQRARRTARNSMVGKTVPNLREAGPEIERAISGIAVLTRRLVSLTCRPISSASPVRDRTSSRNGLTL